jgi:hypothetical protein
MNPWQEIDRLIRIRQRVSRFGKIVLVALSAAVLVTVGWAWSHTTGNRHDVHQDPPRVAGTP